jgi:hypothetical protein
LHMRGKRKKHQSFFDAQVQASLPTQSHQKQRGVKR